MSYQCPICHSKLSITERAYTCENRHQFDMAKEGYVNLMPVQHKRSKDPGDNKEMMLARRAFLEHDYYHPLREIVADKLIEFACRPLQAVVDIGCGEGYYTQEFARRAKQSNEHCQTYGLDISKAAIKFAAKRYPNVAFSVASSHRLPFFDDTLDSIIRIYAPCKHEELLRCLKDGGTMITVTPASHHLYELRELIYQDVNLHDENAEDIAGLTLISEQTLTYPMHLTGKQCLDLLQMTPFAWKADDALKANLAERKEFECRADFMIRVYKKQSKSI
ncbi:23S rRNA (guanine(745)-N(1))-methyltransferase [Vibrio sp. ZSDZ34]|uniref:23S rRNA (Guanine(745)-N(1))-methyltransferase n=1 Tax=Vibrio gelatinilyticus TaxID=2893468 RepID=A0A9X1W831_9VIBR|nr:23S rRNA (guanine(745)-N(1))-methyltransferase [Vibrio gelatinilyticus]MCJ2375466.1 23S rRNA (guanine(745)-N(1))-methyltransferase [Vibrio gelatinilyticus]